MRKNLLVPWLLACLGFLALTACYRPHYDPLLSASARFEEGLTKVARLGPFQSDRDSIEGGWFIPDRTATPTSGWWARYSSSNLNLTYISGTSILGSRSYWNMGMGEDSFILPLTASAASGLSTAIPPKGYLFLGDCDLSAPYYGFEAAGMDATHTSMTTLAPTSVTAPGAGYSFVGASLGSYFLPTSDCATLAFAWEDGALYHFASWHTVIPNDVALGSYSFVAASEFTVYQGPRLREGAFVAHDSLSGRYYLSGYSQVDGSLYSCYWQDVAMAPTALAGIDTKLTALLSDGRLLARDGGVTKLYSAEGALEATLTSGSLRFCYEIFLAGAYHSVFTRTFMIQDGSDYSQVQAYVEAFRVPTADLASLGD